MDKNKFLTHVNDFEKNVIAIDFDGVIHDHYLGFHDGTVYGEPIPGALEAIEELSNNYKIVIFSSKANPDRPLIEGKTGVELIWEWLERHKINCYVKDVTFSKINAKYYIDDKAIHFNNWGDVLSKINN
tara:strand:- start:648 stop:1034 length:387 start_codon:yes stop_codon:yes gene_type:complete